MWTEHPLRYAFVLTLILTCHIDRVSAERTLTHASVLTLTLTSRGQSIRRAHADLSVGYMTWTSGELLDANINRSPTAYLRNPQEERDRRVP